jgi:hypothetical protein
MKKEKFVQFLDDLQELYRIESEMTAVFMKLNSDFNQISFGKFESLIVKLLEEVMQDENEWISWWIYEADFGKKTKIANSVTIEVGKKFPLKDAGDLYDLIMTQ